MDYLASLKIASLSRRGILSQENSKSAEIHRLGQLARDSTPAGNVGDEYEPEPDQSWWIGIAAVAAFILFLAAVFFWWPSDPLHQERLCKGCVDRAGDRK